MCGRARCSLSREAALAAAHITSEQRWQDAAKYNPSYNCSPGSWLPVIRMGPDGARELYTMKWGLVPSFTKLTPGERPDHYRMFNARCETLAEKSIFRRLLPGRRCVVLLEGFYEWQDQGGGRKQPFHVTTSTLGPEQPAMYMAGLYDVCKDANGEPMHTFTIITTDSSKPLAWLHNRMPVILTSQEEVAAWLGEGDAAAAIAPKASGGSLGQGSDKMRGGEEEEIGEAKASQAPPAAAAAAAAAGASITSSLSAGTGGGDSRDYASTESHPSDSEELDTDRPGGQEAKDGQRAEKESTVAAARTRGRRRRREEGDGGEGKKRRVGSSGDQGNVLSLVEQLCQPYGGPLLRWHPVTPEMGKPSYNKPDACEDVRTKKGSITSFFKAAAVNPKAGSAAAAAAKAPVAKPESPAATSKGSSQVKRELPSPKKPTPGKRQPQPQPQPQQRQQQQLQGLWKALEMPKEAEKGGGEPVVKQEVEMEQEQPRAEAEMEAAPTLNTDECEEEV